MNRVLKRPMFRRGGSTGGITSGLRQGYQGTDNAWEQFVKKIPDIREQAKEAAYKPRGTNVNDFLTEWGLDLISRPAAGNIFQQAATSAKEPYQRFMERKETARGQEYASESDMFKTMLSSYGDILSAEAEGKAEGKGWLEQWKFEQIPILNKKIRDLTAKQGDGTITADEELELENSIDQKGRIVSLDPVTEAWLKTKDGGYAVVDMKDRLLEEDQKLPEEERKYKGKKDIQLTIDAIDAVNRELRAEGGRAGYANAGAVMPGQPTQAQGETNQINISYGQLRERLPPEISNEIVLLLSKSYEAFADFAEIQTQADVNEFNTKYNVQLFLPKQSGA